VAKRVMYIFTLIVLLMVVSAFSQEKKSVRIAVIDTGVSADAISAANISEGKNYILPDNTADDIEGHGTAVASIIVGSETAGVDGICPSAVIVPLVYYTKKEDGSIVRGDLRMTAKIIRDAIDVYKCDIINISSGTARKSFELEQAVKYAEEKGILIVSSAGNDGGSEIYYPGGYDSVLCVGALGEDDGGAASFSNRHSDVDILAPGSNIKVADIDGTQLAVSGTSFSAAYVTGVVAGIMAEHPELSALKIRKLLKSSAKDMCTPGFDNESGWGMVDASVADGYADVGRLFRDVKPDAWYFKAVNEAAEFGIMSGTDEVTFSPLIPTTRAMLWTMLYRIDGGNSSSADDVWYSAAQKWSVENGISDGTKPNDAITREQIATILHRYAKLKGKDVSAGNSENLASYSDFSSVSEYAVEAMQFMVDNGCLKGKSTTTLNPRDTATRAEIAAILVRFLRMCNDL